MSGLSDEDHKDLIKAWVGSDVSRGIEWLTPAVEAIRDRAVNAALNEAADALDERAELEGEAPWDDVQAYTDAADIVRQHLT